MATETIDWTALEADPAFRALVRRKQRFLWGLLAFAIGYYFLLPVGAAWYGALYRVPVFGPINSGLLFALSQFGVAWAVAALYARRAQDFDRESAAIAARAAAAEPRP